MHGILLVNLNSILGLSLGLIGRAGSIVEFKEVYFYPGIPSPNFIEVEIGDNWLLVSKSDIFIL